MGTLNIKSDEFQYQWASDVDFDGIRLEVLTDQGEVMFDVSVPEQGEITVNTFSSEVSAALIAAAVHIAQTR